MSDYIAKRKASLGLSESNNAGTSQKNDYISDRKAAVSSAVVTDFLNAAEKLSEDLRTSNYRSAINRFPTLQEQKDKIKSFVDRNKNQFGQKTYQEWKNVFQFFDDAGAQIQAYQKKLDYDTDKGQKEIDYLGRVYEEYKTLSRTMTDDWGTARLEQLRNEYGELSDLERLITQKETERNQAGYAQQQYAMSDMDMSRAAFDVEGEQAALAELKRDYEEYYGQIVNGNTRDPQLLSQFTGKYGTLNDLQNQIREKEKQIQSHDTTSDGVYAYINNRDGYRDKYQQMLGRIRNQGDPMSQAFVDFLGPDSGDKFAERGYDRLTENEIALYNYHYERGGQEEANRYLDSIQEVLNTRVAEERFRDVGSSTAEEILFGLEAGVDSYWSNVKAYLDTESDYIPYSADQITAAMVREDLAGAGPEIFGNSLGQVGFDFLNTTANMAPSILVSTLVGTLAPGAGQAAGAAMIGMSAAGGAYQEALNRGYNKDQARLYGNAIGASEAAMSYLLGGISKLGGIATNGALTAALSKVDNGFLRAIGMLGGDFLSEGTEEGLQSILEPVFRNLILHTDEKIDWEEVGYSALLGGLTALVMEGGETVAASVDTYQTGKQLKESGAVQRLKEAGSTFAADTVAYRLANKVNENTDAYTIGRLFNEVDANLTEQNISDIKNALVKQGMDAELADANARAMERIVEGEKITAAQVAVIQANEPLARAVRTTLIDPNATWFQRTKSFTEAAGKLDAARGTKEAPAAKQADGTQEAAETPSTEEPKRAVQFKSIGKKDATVILEDGTEAPLDAADIDPDEAVVLETIASMDGITVQDANFMLGALNVGQSPESTGTLRHMAGYGAREAFQYGYYGAGQEQISQYGSFANSLTKAQQDAIYNLGKQAGQRAAQQKQTEVKAVQQKQTEAMTEQNTDRKKPGKVHMEGSRKGLTQRQRTSLKALDRIADIMGIQIYIYESKVTATGKRSGENGWYNPADGSIHIDLFAGQNGEGTILFTAAHELTHFIRQWSPEKFKVLADFLIEQYGKKGISLESLVRNQQEKARRNGRDLSYDDAYEEVIADSMETMLSDTKVMEKLALLKQQDQTLWEKIRSYINQLAEKIRAVYRGMKPDTQEGQYVAEMVDALDRIQQLFAEGLADASGNYQMAEKNTAENSGEDGDYDIKLMAREEDAFKQFAKSINSIINRSVSGKGYIDGEILVEKIIPVGPKLAAMVSKSSGNTIDISKKSIALNSSSIWHEYKRHTVVNDEVSRGQIAFTKRQFQNAVKCIVSPDMVETIFSSASNPTQSQSFAYAKKTVRGHYVVVEAVGGKRSPYIYPVMILQFSKSKWDKMMAEGRTLGELLFETDPKKLQALDIVHNKKSRVSAAQFASYEAIANTLRSSQLNDMVSETEPKIKNKDAEKSSISRQAKFSGRNFSDVSDYAENIFGLTTDFEEVGYILPNGKMLRFTDDNHRGERIYDHRAIGLAYGINVDLYANHGFNEESAKFMEEYIENGGIRFDPGILEFNMDAGMQLSKNNPITKEQEQVIRDFIKWKKEREEKYNVEEDPLSLYDGPLPLHIDFGANSNFAVSTGTKELDAWGVKHLSYEGGQINASRIIADIRHFYKTGETRKPSSIAQFRYSSRDSESVSPRALLANAFEDLATTELEKKKLAEYREKIDTLNRDEARLREVRAQIKELSFAKGPRDKAQIRKLQDEAIGIANRIGIWDKQLLRLEASHPLQKVIEREKQKAIHRTKKRAQESMTTYREKTNATAMRRKIQRTVDELNRLLLREDKKNHVPDNLKKAVADALKLVNMDTSDTEARLARYEALIANETDQDKIDAYTVTMENIRRQGERMGEKLQALRDAYEEISQSNDPDIANAYDEGIAGNLKELAATIGDTSIKDMSLEQLSDVYDMYRAVLTRVRDANKAFIAAKGETITQLGDAAIFEVGSQKKEKPLMIPGESTAKTFSWNNLKPWYAFDRIGSATLSRLFDNVRAGEDTWAVDMEEGRAYLLDKRERYGFDKWDLNKTYSFQSTSGLDFQLTLEQIMSLYAYSRRDQAMEHLQKGGFVFDKNTEITIKNKLGMPVKFNPTEATAYNLSPEILADIIGTLTPEQKAYTEEMQAYLSDTMGAKGNEVSMAMYGIKLFKEKNYFPLKSSTEYMERAREQQNQDVKLKNAGFTKSTTPHASNPIVLTPFSQVWANHVNEMSMYHAFTLPLEDFYRVFNYKTPVSETGAVKSVISTITNAHTDAAVKYVDQLLKDLNGGARMDPRAGLMNTLISNFKKGAVFASASVVFQQPSAIARALALIDRKYFFGFKIGAKRHRELWTEVKKYAPVAVIKEMGAFDTNVGKSSVDYLTGKEHDRFWDLLVHLDAKGIGRNLWDAVKDSKYRDELLSRAPAYADEKAWIGIWNAVKRETRDKHPGMDTQSDAFLKLCGKRFTDVIVQTQVYDSVLARSANMRSKDTGMKMATAFMAEPTVSINMMEKALRNGIRKKESRRAIGAVMTSMVLNSILVSFVYADRDDDEEDSYGEKYLRHLAGSIVDGVNPFTYIPFLKDAWSIVQGYDTQRSDMAVLSDVWDGWQKLFQEDVSPWMKVEKFWATLVQATGILPAKNIMRDLRGAYQFFDTLLNGEKGTAVGALHAITGGASGDSMTTKEELYDAVVRAETSKAEWVRDKYDAHALRVMARYEDEESARAAIRSVIREKFMEAELTGAEAMEQLQKYGDMEYVDAYWKVDEWESILNGEEEYGKFDDLYEAVETGKDLNAVFRRYSENGVTEKTLRSQITEHFHEVYLETTDNQRSRLRASIIEGFVLTGMDRELAEKKLADWDYEGEHGFLWEDRKTAYSEGTVSASELEKLFVEQGWEPEEAKYQVEAYNWQKQGYDYASASNVAAYDMYCAAFNVPRDVYLDICQFVNNTKNDVDPETGASIKYSAVKKIMAEIDSYSLTPAQKTAIAQSIGEMSNWKDSTIRKYKLW